MRVTLGNAKRRFVYDVKFGSRQIRRIMYGGKQIWPDDTERVATMAVDMSGMEGSLDGAYWVHALEAVRAGCGEKCHMKLRAGGRDYLLQTTYGKWKKAVYDAGVVDFLGNGPLREDLRVGDTVKVSLVVPQVKTGSIGGSQSRYEAQALWNYENGRYVTSQYPPTIPHTSVHGFFCKGQKKVSTGNRIIVRASGGRVLMDKHLQQNGHRRGEYDWDWGTVGFCQGCEYVTLTVVPHQSRGPWGGYFIYPAFTRSIRLKVTGLTYNRVV